MVCGKCGALYDRGKSSCGHQATPVQTSPNRAVTDPLDAAIYDLEAKLKQEGFDVHAKGPTVGSVELSWYHFGDGVGWRVAAGNQPLTMLQAEPNKIRLARHIPDLVVAIRAAKAEAVSSKNDVINLVRGLL